MAVQVGSFGSQNDACALSALSVLAAAPDADMLVTMDPAGAARWGAVLRSHGMRVEAWAPWMEPLPEVARIAERLRLAPVPPADRGDLQACCIANTRHRMLLHFLRGGLLLDADTVVMRRGLETAFSPRSRYEFVVSAYTRRQACCGIRACGPRHPLMVEWYRRMATRARRRGGLVWEEVYFNSRLNRWRWPLRLVHGTSPMIYDVRSPGARGRAARVFRHSEVWSPDARWAPIAHYHYARDRRVQGSPRYSDMTVGDVLAFPLDGAGAGNAVVAAMRRAVDAFGLHSM